MEKVGGCLLAQKGKSGSRLPLKHFHTSVTRIHTSNPIYSGTGKIEKENSFVHFFMEYGEPKWGGGGTLFLHKFIHQTMYETAL